MNVYLLIGMLILYIIYTFRDWIKTSILCGIDKTFVKRSKSTDYDNLDMINTRSHDQIILDIFKNGNLDSMESSVKPIEYEEPKPNNIFINISDDNVYKASKGLKLKRLLLEKNVITFKE